MRLGKALGVVVWLSVLTGSAVQAGDVPFRDQVEADWLLQEQYRYGATPRDLTPESDAAGACDGVKDGEWGFHTSQQDAPWWQVDLGGECLVQRVVVWNRCDSVAPRAAHLKLLASADGASWQEWYAHNGAVFYGFSDNAPLAIDIGGRPARFVRIQLPGADFLHLDEVEVFGVAEPDRNLALHRPALQSSLSQWSKDHGPSAPVDWAERFERVVTHTAALLDELETEGVEVSGDRALLAHVAEREGRGGLSRGALAPAQTHVCAPAPVVRHDILRQTPAGDL